MKMISIDSFGQKLYPYLNAGANFIQTNYYNFALFGNVDLGLIKRNSGIGVNIYYPMNLTGKMSINYGLGINYSYQFLKEKKYRMRFCIGLSYFDGSMVSGKWRTDTSGTSYTYSKSAFGHFYTTNIEYGLGQNFYMVFSPSIGILMLADDDLPSILPLTAVETKRTQLSYALAISLKKVFD